MTQAQRQVGQLLMLINRNPLPAEVMDSLIEAIVEDDLAQPAMFTLRFNDPTFELLDGKLFALGNEVTFKAKSSVSNQPQPLLIGEITALEPTLKQQNLTLLVRGYDRSHRLHRGSKTRTFLKQTDSEIAEQIARETGLRADVERTSIRHEYILQDNMTDMEFLHSRAVRIGYRVAVVDSTLVFRRVEGSPSTAPVQEWGRTLLNFRACLSAVAQPNNVQVRGWDAATKRALVGKAARPSRPNHTDSAQDEQSAGTVAQRAFGTAAMLTITDQPVGTQDEAEALAQAILDAVSGDYFTAEGLCRGEPALRAGTMVEMKGVGKRLSGDYFVTASRHAYTATSGYTTTFFVSGRRPTGLWALLDKHSERQTFGGVTIGVVTNINDPDALGRVKVKLPWMDDGHESDWTRLAMPGGGKGRGFFTPQVGDEVLVAFEHGDRGRPYVIGGLWNKKDQPPNGAVQKGQGLLHIQTSNGNIIRISDSDKKIEITSQRHSITLDDQGQMVRIESGRDLEIKGPNGKLSITAQGVELSSSTKLTVKANTDLVINGKPVRIN